MKESSFQRYVFRRQAVVSIGCLLLLCVVCCNVMFTSVCGTLVTTVWVERAPFSLASVNGKTFRIRKLKPSVPRNPHQLGNSLLEK